MEEIISLLAHFQEQLQVLTDDFQEVKNTIYNIYKENENLKEENHNLRNLLFEDEEEGKGESPGYNNLVRLYEEGFHICHFNFGESRQNECLFCTGLLDNNLEGTEEDEIGKN